jgi:hypothetical protein
MSYWIWPVSTTETSTQTLNEFSDEGKSSDAEVFIREAVQNSLDARLDDEEPVEIKITIKQHVSEIIYRKFFSELSDYRVQTEWPPIDFDHKTCLVYEDSNTTGIKGKLDKREPESSFWTFLMYWGAEKIGSGLGRYGKGRVAIIGASRYNTLLFLTKREDGSQASAGLSFIKPMFSESKDGLQGTQCYFFAGEEPAQGAYPLHDQSVTEDLIRSFNIDEFQGSGTKLIVPFIKDTVNEGRIKAALIAHFAPSLLNGDLLVSVNGNLMDEETIEDFCQAIKDNLGSPAAPLKKLANNPEDFLIFQKKFLKNDDDYAKLPTHSDPVWDPNPNPYQRLVHLELAQAERLTQAQDRDGKPIADRREEIVDHINSGELTIVKVGFPIKKVGRAEVQTYITVAIQKAEDGNEDAVELHFRKGMAIPRNREKLKGGYYASLFADDNGVADYLNICESKAHLEWTFSKAVQHSLKEKYEMEKLDGIQKLCVEFFSSISTWMNESQGEIKRNILSNYFNIPKSANAGDRARKEDGSDSDKGDSGTQDIDVEVEKSNKDPWTVPLFSGKGFMFTGRQVEGTNFPRQIKVTAAYDDGSSNPHSSWESWDFKYSELDIESVYCSVTRNEDHLLIDAENEDFKVSVEGFDLNRMLDVKVI